MFAPTRATDIEDANNLILLTDSALCQKKGNEHRAHSSFLTRMPVTSSTPEGELMSRPCCWTTSNITAPCQSFRTRRFSRLWRSSRRRWPKTRRHLSQPHRRTGSFNSGKHDVYAVVNHACPRRILDLYTQSLQKLTYFCVIDNPRPVDMLPMPKDPQGSQAS